MLFTFKNHYRLLIDGPQLFVLWRNLRSFKKFLLVFTFIYCSSRHPFLCGIILVEHG